MSLRMLTSRADIRSDTAFMNIAAVIAFPENFFIFLEDFTILHIVSQFEITIFMMFLDPGDHAERGRDILKAFFFSDIGKLDIKISPFFMFTGCGGDQMVMCVAIGDRIRRRDLDRYGLIGAVQALVDMLVEHFGMFLFIVCSLKKNG